MYLPTASKLGLAAKCVYPWTGRTPWPKQGPNQFSDFGNAVHKAAEVGPAADLDAIAAEHRLQGPDKARFKRCAARVAEWLFTQPPAEWAYAEVAFAYDVQTGRARTLEQRHHRDYSSIKKGELSGTVDAVRLLPSKVLVLDDYKTGRASGVEPAITNMQLRFLALCAARVYGASSVLTRLVYIDEYSVFTDEAMLDEIDLGDVAADLSSIWKSLQTPGEPTPGPWCHDAWCPIRAKCPATDAASQGIVKLEQPLTLEIRDASHATYTRHRLKVVRDQLDAIDDALKAWVREHGPIPVGDGRVYGIRTIERESVDLTVPGAYQALVQSIGEENADQAVELSTSKAAIKRAAGGKERERVALDALAKIGAIKTSRYERLEEYEEKNR